MRNRGSVDRRTGMTTLRNKAKTHWGAKGRVARSPNPGKPAKAGASSSPQGSP